MNELRRLARRIEVDEPHLALVKESEARAFGGNCGRVAFAQEWRSAASERHEPYVLLDVLRRARRIRIGRARVFQVAAAHVDNGGSVWEPGDISNVLAVIPGVAGQL